MMIMLLMVVVVVIVVEVVTAAGVVVVAILYQVWTEFLQSVKWNDWKLWNWGDTFLAFGDVHYIMLTYEFFNTPPPF